MRGPPNYPGLWKRARWTIWVLIPLLAWQLFLALETDNPWWRLTAGLGLVWVFGEALSRSKSLGDGSPNPYDPDEKQ